MIFEPYILEKLDRIFFHTPLSVQAFPLVESKDFGDFSPDPGRQAILNTFQDQSDRTGASLKAFDRLQSAYLKKFSAILRKTSNRSLGIPAADKEAEALLSDYFRRAFLLGRLSTGSKFLDEFPVSPEELDFIQKAAETELTFARRFLRQAKSSQSWNPVRAGMYAKTLESLYTSGWVASLPEGTLIFWILHAKESCPDCIRLAKGGPYRIGKGRKSLATVPRAGATRCLSHCKCELRVELPKKDVKETEIGQDLLSRPVVSGTSGDKAVDSLMALRYEEMNLVRQKMVLETDPGRLAILAARRRVLNDEIIQIQTQSKSAFVPQFSVRDLQAAALQVKDLPEVKFGDLKKGDSVAVLKNAFSIPSVVARKTRTLVELINPYGTFQFAPQDWVMYFQRPPSP